MDLDSDHLGQVYECDVCYGTICINRNENSFWKSCAHTGNNDNAPNGQRNLATIIAIFFSFLFYGRFSVKIFVHMICKCLFKYKSNSKSQAVRTNVWRMQNHKLFLCIIRDCIWNEKLYYFFFVSFKMCNQLSSVFE